MPTFRSIGDAIRKEVEPVLRDKGFSGRYPHYRRKLEGRADLVTFQANQHGGSFAVEIAQAPGEGVTLFGTREFIPYEELNAWHLEPIFHLRERIGSGLFGLSEWFHYDRVWQRILFKRPERLRFAARSAAKRIPRIEARFERWRRTAPTDPVGDGRSDHPVSG